jgi:hypothetical protein
MLETIILGQRAAYYDCGCPEWKPSLRSRAWALIGRVTGRAVRTVLLPVLGALEAAGAWLLARPAVQAAWRWLSRYRAVRVLAAWVRLALKRQPWWAKWVAGACALIPGPVDELVILPMLIAYVALRNWGEFATVTRQAWAR